MLLYNHINLLIIIHNLFTKVLFGLCFIGATLDVRAENPKSGVEASSYEIVDGGNGAGLAVWATSDRVIVLGGLDLQGQVSSRVDILEPSEAGSHSLTAIGKLKAGRAWSAFVGTGESCLLIGGTDGVNVLRSVLHLTLENGELVETELPELPVGLAMAGASLLGNDVFVVGGTKKWHTWEASDRVFRLSLDRIDQGWIEIEPLPGGSVVDPAVVTQFGEIHVLGGWRNSVGTDGAVAKRWVSVADAWGFRVAPIDGTSRKGWRKLADIPVSLAGAVALGSGQSHVLLIGGVTGEAGSGLTGSEVFAFHNLTDTWVKIGATLAAAGTAEGVKTAEEYLILSPNADGGTTVHQFILDRYEIGLGDLDYLVVFIYFLGLAGIGWYFARKQDSSEEYSLGGRDVRWWAAGISMFATAASSISFMALPAIAFASNMVFLIPTLIVVPFFFFIHGWIIYPLLRRLTLTSTYEYLEMRFNLSLRLLASFQCISFQIAGRMSVVLLLPSLAISATTGLDVITSVVIMGILTTIYTTLGGFEAVVWTDVTQGLLMMCGMLLMIGMAIGGLPGGVDEFFSIGREFNKFDFAIFDFNLAAPIIYIFIIQVVFQQISSIGEQPVVQRVFATPERDMKKLAGMSQLCGWVIALISSFTGLAIFAFFRSRPDLLDPTMTNDQVVPLFIIQRLPVGVAGLIIAALFAASMSTLSSSMNSVATLINRDFVSLIRPDMTDHHQLLLMKWMSLATGLVGTGIAVYMASLEITSMFEIWSQISALLGGGFIGMYILGMFTRRANSFGVITGALVSVVVTFATKQYGDFHYIFLTPVAIGTCLIVGYIASVLTPQFGKSNLSGLTVFEKEQDVVPIPNPTSHL